MFIRIFLVLVRFLWSIPLNVNFVFIRSNFLADKNFSGPSNDAICLSHYLNRFLEVLRSIFKWGLIIPKEYKIENLLKITHIYVIFCSFNCIITSRQNYIHNKCKFVGKYETLGILLPFYPFTKLWKLITASIVSSI